MTTLSTNYLFQNFESDNYMLKKDDIGKGKESCFDLPNLGFSYGHFPRSDPENVGQLCSKWVSHKETRERYPLKNFQLMNKESILNGACTSKNQQSFRKSNQRFTKIKKGKFEIEYKLPEENFIYGKQNDYSNPISLLIGNLYGLQAELQLQKTYTNRNNQRNELKNKSMSRENQSLISIQNFNKQNIKANYSNKELNIFKIAKFSKIKAKIDSQNKSSASVQLLKTLKLRSLNKTKQD